MSVSHAQQHQVLSRCIHTCMLGYLLEHSLRSCKSLIDTLRCCSHCPSAKTLDFSSVVIHMSNQNCKIILSSGQPTAEGSCNSGIDQFGLCICAFQRHKSILPQGDRKRTRLNSSH